MNAFRLIGYNLLNVNFIYLTHSLTTRTCSLWGIE